MTLLGRAALCVFLIRLYLLCLCVVAAPTAALAQKSPGANTALVVLTDQTSAYPLSGRSEFWIDPTGQASVNDVDTQQNSLGFALRSDKAELLHGRALWIRFAVRSDRLANTRWFLEMPLAGVDQVTLHHRNAAGQWQAQSAGDRLPQAQWPQAGRYPVFQLQDDPQLTTYLVQVRHARVPFSGRLQIVSQTHLITQHETEQFYLGAYFGLAVLVVLVAAVTALFNRDLGFGSYACYVAALAGAQAAFTGIAPQHVWPHLPTVGNGAVFFLPVLAAAMGLWFVRTVTTPRQFSPLLDHGVMLLAGALVLAGLVDMFFPTQTSFAVVNNLILAAIAALLAVIVLTLREGDLNARWVALGFLPILVATLFPVLRNFGLIASGFFTEYGLILGSAIEMPILFIGLQRRLNQRSEAQGRARALSQTDPLTGLVQRRVFYHRLKGSLMRAKRYNHSCALLVVGVANHSGLLRERGREAAEKALVLAASQLRSLVRDVDTAARVGDQQFALLIEGPTSLQRAQDLATRAVARGLQPSDLLPGGTVLKFHVALAVLPAGWQAQPSALLSRFLDELQAMEPDARKAIRVVTLSG